MYSFAPCHRDIFSLSTYIIVQYFIQSVSNTHLMAVCPGLPGWAGTRKVKPIWILLKQETVSGSGISWAICKSAPRSRQITTPAPHHSFFTVRMPFLPPNQQRQSTEGNNMHVTDTKTVAGISNLISNEPGTSVVCIHCDRPMWACFLIFG